LSQYVELEIQTLLNSMSDPAELPLVGQKLIEGLERSPSHFTAENIQAATLFLLNAGLHHTLMGFYSRHISNPEFPLVWSHFLQSLSIHKELLTEKLLAAIQQGLDESEAWSEEASRSDGAVDLFPNLKSARMKRRAGIADTHQKGKRQLLDQIVTLRTQQLHQQEKAVLTRLQKLYPGDPDVAKEVQEYKQRHALEILQKHAPQNRELRMEEMPTSDPEIEKSMQILNQDLLDKADQDPSLALDFCIMALMLESYETALTLLSYCEETPSTWWLRMEILLRCRRYLELLTDLSRLELLLANDPETFFASAYLRAQALWGLGQKHNAIEILEGLMTARPYYRATSALLGTWGHL
jgi:hypothetical protein